MQELDLADCPHLEDDSNATDVLIGADHYWDIVTGDITREGDGPVAITNRLGWLLSRPARDQINRFSRTATYVGLTESVNTEYRNKISLLLSCNSFGTLSPLESLKTLH